MNVSFTKKEYARLLELVHIGLYVTGPGLDDPSSTPEPYAELAQKLFAAADDMGCEDLVEADEEGLLFASEKLQKGTIHGKLDTFIDASFWEELAGRLADRDMLLERGLLSQRGSITLPELITEADEERMEVIESIYWDEFEKCGIDNLHLLKGGQG
jgi:hypothetical protein